LGRHPLHLRRSTRHVQQGDRLKRVQAVARQALTYCLYAVSDDGCPADRATERDRGGWQEDAHTDKLHNFVDAMTAFPEWAK